MASKYDGFRFDDMGRGRFGAISMYPMYLVIHRIRQILMESELHSIQPLRKVAKIARDIIAEGEETLIPACIKLCHDTNDNEIREILSDF